METRSKAQGHPLKKEGAYDTDKYYQEKDEGFGDVGVRQEKDAGVTQAERKDKDPDFTVEPDVERRADEELQQEPEADVPLEEDVADLKAGPKEDVRTRAPDGEPVPIVPVSDVEQEVMEACVTVQGEVPEAARV